MIQNFWVHRALIHQLTKREILERYQGSYLGLVWSFITPLAMLAVYTIVFSVIFKSRWENTVTGSRAEVAMIIFTGLIAFEVFNETMLTAPRLVVSRANYVKKVVFPLEILSISKMGSTLTNSLFSLLILLIGTTIFMGGFSWMIIFLPLMYIPLILLCLGLSWFLASLGVFIRDIAHLLGVIVRILFFLTPIFYPASIVPPQLGILLHLNPLTFIINHFRRVILWGQMPDWGEYLVVSMGAFIIYLFGYIWFMKSKKTFADVI
ncbi:MAG: ABC transporter permease [Anaerolineae bacterium]|nr:ABC transporter permease [Anaerolineae bacterium]